MKKIALIIVMLLATATAFAQITINGKSLEEFEQEIRVHEVEDSLMEIAEALAYGGRFNLAIAKLDDIKNNPPQISGWKLSGHYYARKALWQMRIEEYNDVIKTADEFTSSITDYESDTYFPIVLGIKGVALQELQDYDNAIICYEKSLDIYSKNKNLSEEAKVFGEIANCYYLMGKTFVADSYYDLSISKYLEYFNITKKKLLKKKIKLQKGSKSIEEFNLDVSSLETFGLYLYGKSIIQSKNENRKALKECLKMGMNCGNKLCEEAYYKLF